MLVYSQLKVASWENLSSDPSLLPVGRFWLNTTSGRAKVRVDGSNTKSLFYTDDPVIVGTSGTASNNILLRRAGTGILQFALANDVTAEGSASTTLAQFGGRIENFATGSLPSTGNAGRIVWDTTVGFVKVDTGAAWVIANNPMTTGGDIIYGGTSGIPTRLANGSSNQFLRSSGGTSAPTWANVTVTNSVTSKTTTYSITNSDYLVLVSASGGGFTVTLPTASGITGQIFTIKRTDQTLANAVTIATTSSQTIDGVTTRKLMTQYEEFTVQSDGSNWVILSHTYPKGWNAYTISTAGLTPSDEGTYWKRDGDSISIYSVFAVGSPSGTTFSFALPSGLVIDAAKLSSATNANYFGQMFQMVGGSSTYPSTTYGPFVVFSDTAVDTGKLYAGTASTGTRFAKSAANAITTDGNRAVLRVSGIPITNWEA